MMDMKDNSTMSTPVQMEDGAHLHTVLNAMVSSKLVYKQHITTILYHMQLIPMLNTFGITTSWSIKRTLILFIKRTGHAYNYF